MAIFTITASGLILVAKSAAVAGAIAGVGKTIQDASPKFKKFTQRILGHNEKLANWVKWWNATARDGAGTQATLNRFIAQAFAAVGVSPDAITAEAHENVVKNIFAQGESEGFNISSTFDAISNFVLTARPEGKTFKSAMSRYANDFNIWTQENSFDSSRFTLEELSRVFLEQYNVRSDSGIPDATEIGEIILNVERIVANDMDDKIELGAFDDKGVKTDQYDSIVGEGGIIKEDFLNERGRPLPEDERPVINDDGTLSPPGTEPPVDPETGEPGLTTFEQQVKDIADELGIELTDAAIEHYGQQLEDKDIDDFQLETLLKASPEYIENEIQIALEENLGILSELSQEEIDIFDQMTRELSTATGDEFEKMAKTIGKVAKLMGGQTREDSFISDRLVETASELDADDRRFIATTKAQILGVQATRRADVKTGAVTEVKGLTAAGQLAAQGVTTSIEQRRSQTIAALSAFDPQKSMLLAQRASDKAGRDSLKLQQRLLREQQEAVNRANKKARKLGAIALPLIGAISSGLSAVTGGGSNLLSRFTGAAITGGAIGSAQSFFANQGLSVEAPSFTNIGAAFRPNTSGMFRFNSKGELVPVG